MNGRIFAAGILKVIMAIVLLSLVAPVVVYGATYYACDCGPGADAACSPGSDTAAGTSPLAPWQTYTKARQAFGGILPGDTVAFCQGGSFAADGGNWMNNRCLAGAPCTVTSYAPSWGNGTQARPIIMTPAGKKCFDLADSGNADHEEGYVFSHLDVRGAGGTIGFFFFNDIDGVVLDDLNISGHEIGVLIQGSNAPNPGSNGLNERITIQNSRIADNAGQGFEGSCDGCSILNNVFDNNGFKGTGLYHNLYWDGASASTGGRIAGNILTHSTMANNKCQGVSLVVHGKHTNLAIENNLVQEEVGKAAETCWGIAVDTAYATAESFTGLVIRGNTVRNVGNVGIGVNACTDCLIEGNIVEQGQLFGTIGINIPDRTKGVEDGTLNRVTVRNNSVAISNNAASQTGLVLGGEGTGHVSTGNSVTYSGAGSGWSCFSYPLPGSAYAAIDNNDCRFAAAPAGAWEKYYSSLADWQFITGFDLHSTDGNASVKPTVTWANPAAITYGTALSATQLNAAASVPGTFVYSPIAGTILPAGTQTLNTIFTPTDAANYTVAAASVTLDVNRTAASVALNGLSQTYNGTPRNITATTVPAGVTVDISYSGVATAPTTAGSYPVVATVADPNYTGSAGGTLTVTQASPSITWATPSAVTVGTTLSASQLNAAASVPGTFFYTPPAGTVLISAGTQTLTTLFTPIDTANYIGASAGVSLTVTPAPLAISTASLPNATRNVAYSTPLAVSGGTSPYTWSLTSGKLPTGLTLTSSTGIISGKTTKSGTATFTIGVKDARGSMVLKTLSLKVI